MENFVDPPPTFSFFLCPPPHIFSCSLHAYFIADPCVLPCIAWRSLASRFGNPVSLQICLSRFLMVSTLSWQDVNSLLYPSGPVSVRGPAMMNVHKIVPLCDNKQYHKDQAV